jgi:hypothetical protein
MEQQVMSIYAVTNGYLDDIPVDDAKRFEEELLQYLETRHAEIAKHIATEGTLPDEVEGKLKAAIEGFKKQFRPTEEGPGTTAGSAGGPVDQRREDVGWDRVGEPEPDAEELAEKFDRPGPPPGPPG